MERKITRTRGVKVNGYAIRAVRIHSGLSQVEAATRAQMSQQHLCNVEAGRQTVMNPRMVQALADVLGADPRAFSGELTPAA